MDAGVPVVGFGLDPNISIYRGLKFGCALCRLRGGPQLRKAYRGPGRKALKPAAFGGQTLPVESSFGGKIEHAMQLSSMMAGSRKTLTLGKGESRAARGIAHSFCRKLAENYLGSDD